MTAPLKAVPPAAAPAPLDPALLARARARSAASQRSLVDEIEAETGADPREIVRALAAPFGLAVAETADMLAFTPAFDLLPLSQALARRCVLLRSPSQRTDRRGGRPVRPRPADLAGRARPAPRRVRRCRPASRSPPTSRPTSASTRNRRARSTA